MGVAMGVKRRLKVFCPVRALLLVDFDGRVLKFYVERPLDLPKNFLPPEVMVWERKRDEDADWPTLDAWLVDGWRFAVAYCAPSVSNDTTSVTLEKPMMEVDFE